MSKHREQLESVLDYIINNESEEAEKLLHDIIVEKAKDIYAALVQEDEELEDEEVEVEEAVGGDPKEDFAKDIKADSEEIDSEEQMEAEDEEDDAEEAEDDEDEGEFDFDDSGELDGHEDEHGEVVDRLEDLEAAIAELTAEFEEVFGDELDGEPEMEFPGDDMDMGADLDMGDDMGALDAEEEMEGLTFEDLEAAALAEATEFLKKVGEQGKGEGKEAGTGPSVAVNKKSTHSTSKRPHHGGEPVDFVGSEESGYHADQAKDETEEDNVDVRPKVAPKAEEKPKHDDKAAKSPLQHAPKKP